MYSVKNFKLEMLQNKKKRHGWMTGTLKLVMKDQNKMKVQYLLFLNI